MAIDFLQSYHFYVCSQAIILCMQTCFLILMLILMLICASMLNAHRVAMQIIPSMTSESRQFITVSCILFQPPHSA